MKPDTIVDFERLGAVMAMGDLNPEHWKLTLYLSGEPFEALVRYDNDFRRLAGDDEVRDPGFVTDLRLRVQSGHEFHLIRRF